MKNALFVLTAMGLLFLMGGQAAQAQNVTAETQAATETAEPQNVGNKICPVMGGPVDEKITYTHEDKVYNFCCPACIEEFKKDPQKYIKIVEAELQAEAQKEKSGQDMKGMDMGMHEGQSH